MSEFHFFVGPLINSKGRLDHPEVALKLLTTDNPNQCFELFNQLDICNKERKFIQNEVFNEARQQVIDAITSDEMLINIVYAPHWHEGVIGIVASKLVETFGVPAIVFSDSEQDGVIKASARSAGELNLFNCLKDCEDLFIKFGGHKAAAGLSMNKENLSAFRTKDASAIKRNPFNSKNCWLKDMT